MLVLHKAVIELLWNRMLQRVESMAMGKAHQIQQTVDQQLSPNYLHLIPNYSTTVWAVVTYLDGLPVVSRTEWKCSVPQKRRLFNNARASVDINLARESTTTNHDARRAEHSSCTFDG